MELNFGLGENFCNVLAQIAREKILYDHDFEAGVDVFTQNLGCDRQQALQLISGKDYVLYVSNNGDCDVTMCERSELPEGKEYEEFDADTLTKFWLETIKREGNRLTKDISGMLSLLYFPGRKVNLSFSAEVKVEDIINAFINERPEDIKDHLYQKMCEMIEDPWEHGDRNFFKFKNLLKTLKFALEWIKDSAAKIEVIKEMSAAGFIDKGEASITEYLDLAPFYVGEVHTTCTTALYMMKTGKSSDDYESLLDEYLKAEENLTTQLRYSIYPTKVEEKYDAGWLSPSGAYFALNGTVANMLHIQIADKLYDQGFIPHNEETNELNQKDSWLEKNGWIRLHHDEIAFWPTEEHKAPTDSQVDKLVKYAKTHYHGTLCNISMGRKTIKASLLEQADKIQRIKMFDVFS